MRSAAEAATAQDPARHDARPGPAPRRTRTAHSGNAVAWRLYPGLVAASAPLRPSSDVAPAPTGAPEERGTPTHPASRIPHPMAS